MSISYIVLPVTQQLLEWGQQCDVPISLDTPNGYAASMADLTDILESLEGFTFNVRGTEDQFNAQVDSIDTYDWQYETADPLMNKAFGGTHTSPKESVTIDRLNPEQQPPSLSFHGDITLTMRIAQELSQKCGPQAAFATCDGIPAFFLPDAPTPVWNEPWL
ncbi:MAG: hypothetical protein K0U86_01755 [Planctomycetes bacterium]|nr:hypothetical protein [Planctomycetota bacterium]MCH9778429.1 hypothetical protein [Planctomycetota bacterium]MCH9791811.1 hypothetical protein [Planctomycetota bacterium]